MFDKTLSRGFYAEREENQEADDFSFMENCVVYDDDENPCLDLPQGVFYLSLYDFLHGYCHIFSLRLHNEYGYEVVNISDKNGNLIHSYCKNDKGEFIDVRGRTADARAFFSEFEDWLDIHDLSGCIFDGKPAVLESESDIKLYEYAGYVLRDYPSYYGKVA